MKVLFLIFHGFAEYNGISKKIHSQINAFKENKCDTHLCYLKYEEDQSHTRYVDNDVIAHYDNSVIGKVKKRYCYGGIRDYIKANGFQLLYIRGFNNANPFLISLIKQIRKDGCKVVYEIPTYPYDGEYKQASRSMKMELFIDQQFRNKLGKALDYIVTFSNKSRIFNAPTIKISNGIDFSTIPLKNSLQNKSNELHLIGVAEVHLWHGFDRLIKGLIAYYKGRPTVNVYFHIVGFSFDDTLDKLKTLAIENGIEKYVIFHGALYGDELNSIFDRMDMGVASLGRHRSGITNIKTLKNREYAARGLSFIYSEDDDDFDEMSYVFKVPADETPIDINRLVEFKKTVNIEPQEIRESIKNLSWTIQMKKVIDQISKE